VVRPVSYQSYQHQSSSFSGIEDDQAEFRLGQRVLHPKFGEGVVTEFEGQGGSAGCVR